LTILVEKFDITLAYIDMISIDQMFRCRFWYQLSKQH